jgi:hypothetical protein
VQCSAVQCTAMQCSAVRCSAGLSAASRSHIRGWGAAIVGHLGATVHCSAVQCSAVQCSAGPNSGPGRPLMVRPGRGHPPALEDDHCLSVGDRVRAIATMGQGRGDHGHGRGDHGHGHSLPRDAALVRVTPL